MHLLEVKDLKTRFKTDGSLVKAVDGISYHIDEGEIVGLVGESGCGKSVSQLSVMQLIPRPPGEIAGGQVFFEGQDLLQFQPNGEEMRSVRGGKISMIFQEPMTSLNPVLPVSRQLTEDAGVASQDGSESGQKRAIELLPDGGHSRRGKAARQFPAPVQRGNAAEDHDCHGAFLQPQAGHRR